MTAWSVAGTAAAASTAAAAAAAGRFGPTAASTSALSHARKLGYNAPAAAFPCARRTYASEAREYRHNNFAGPPPPPPLSTAPGLTSTASPSRTSSTVSSSASSGKDASSSAPLSRSVASRQPPLPGSPQHAAYAPDLPDTFGHNQDACALNQGVGLEGGLQGADEELQRDLESIVAHFRAPIRYAFAYGSGVLKQAGYSDKDKPMLDFVFAVSHPSHWHALNIHQNKEHYSLLARMLGSNIISILQTRVGASVWFNVECLVRGRIIKYGVVSVDSLVRDLLDWETLYLAGRLHKPVRVLRDEPRARLAAQVNLSSAVRTALLLLPETFSEEDLYTEVAALSYRGDFRMAVGENPNKVKNIVAAQGEQFQRLYQPILRSFHKHISFMGPEGSGSIRQDVSPRAKADLAKRLPARLKGALHGQYQRELNWYAALGKTVEGASSGSAGAGEKKASLSEETALWTKIVAQGNFKQSVDKTVQMIVGRPAFSQSAKGVVSVGPIRGLRYVWPKLKKKWAPGK